MTLAIATRLGVWLGASVIVAAGQAPGGRSTSPTSEPDHRAKPQIVMLVFGDSGTGEAGQARIGRAMFDVCRARQCDLALVLGDAIYENGIEVRQRSDASRSAEEIRAQFRLKFEAPYEPFRALSGFRFWVALGNHDYRRHTLSTLIDYSRVSDLWRLPAFHYDVPALPDWLQIRAIHTDTDVGRDLNGLQVDVLKQSLCAEGRTPRWKFAFGHHPVYNSGQHRGDANERRVRALLEEPLLRACGVHVYFAGHAHHQEHLSAPGFEQVIQGAAAQIDGRNRPDRGLPARQRYASHTFGFAVVVVDPERVRMDFYDVRGTRARGAFVQPSPDDVVVRYSWCATREEVGRPEREARPCG